MSNHGDPRPRGPGPFSAPGSLPSLVASVLYAATAATRGDLVEEHAGRDRASIDALRARFRAHGQEHVFQFWSRLDEHQRRRLLSQAAELDLEALARIHRTTREVAAPGARRLEPFPITRHPAHGGDPAAWKEATRRGEALLARGELAVLVVAGGQGTRLGFEGPKGAFRLGPVSERTLFEQQAQKIRGLRRRLGKRVPWYLMTSGATDDATRELFAESAFFGLPPEDVFFFCQPMVPALDFEGRLILEEPSRIFESPNGHGGVLTALLESGALDHMERRGVRSIFYYQVDNPLVRIGDPAYLGFHLEAGAEMSAKVIRKRSPDEKMGVIARIDGRVGIVEYTELDDPHRHLRDGSGELVYWAGSIAVHLLQVDFVRRVAAEAERHLPYHASAKKIPTVDPEGRNVAPAAPNGYKLERFVFDALPAARAVCVVEALREEEYSPIKNAEGEDSPASARRDLSALCRRWIVEAGLEPPPAGSRIEIDHSRFDGSEDLRASGIRSIAEAGDAIRLAAGAER